jgi:hypothetical protein
MDLFAEQWLLLNVMPSLIYNLNFNTEKLIVFSLNTYSIVFIKPIE